MLQKRLDYLVLGLVIGLGFSLLAHPAACEENGATASPLATEASPAESQEENGEEPEEGGEADVARSLALGNSTLELYGFVRIDAIYDDSRPNAAQTPTFIPSEDSPETTDESNFTLHPRLTRFGANLEGPEIDALGGARVLGKVEIDFQAGGSESRQKIRMRHGWFKLAWEDSSLLAGQTWDIISPLYPTVNSDTLMWNAGNLGDRRPQIRFTHEPGNVSFVAGVGLSGAIDAKDLDDDGVRDGERASLPHLQARLGGRIPLGGDRVAALGISGHAAEEEISTPIAGEESFSSHSISLDYAIDLTSRLVWRGELWTGENLSDFRGGIGQGVNVATGEEIASEGGWTELGIDISEVYSFYTGYTLDDPDDEDLFPGARSENYAWYVVNRFQLGPAFLLGVDYLNWTTEFLGRPDGDDNRFNLYAIYKF